MHPCTPISCHSSISTPMPLHTWQRCLDRFADSIDFTSFSRRYHSYAAITSTPRPLLLHGRFSFTVASPRTAASPPLWPIAISFCCMAVATPSHHTDPSQRAGSLESSGRIAGTISYKHRYAMCQSAASTCYIAGNKQMFSDAPPPLPASFLMSSSLHDVTLSSSNKSHVPPDNQ